MSEQVCRTMSNVEKIVTKGDLLRALQRAVTQLGRFLDNPPKGTTFKQFVRGESRETLEAIEAVTQVRP